MAALHGDIHYQALVWRDGKQRELDVGLLVPGEGVGLRIGGVVPADVRTVEADQLECDEAVLTGESMAATKQPEPAAGTDSAVDLPSCAFMGTVVHATRRRWARWGRSEATRSIRRLQLAGFLSFVDRPKADAGGSIVKLNRLDIAVKLITADNGTVASKVSP